MEINIGMSECHKNVDNYYGSNITVPILRFGSLAAPAERLSTVSSSFLSLNQILDSSARPEFNIVSIFASELFKFKRELKTQ